VIRPRAIIFARATLVVKIGSATGTFSGNFSLTGDIVSASLTGTVTGISMVSGVNTIKMTGLSQLLDVLEAGLESGDLATVNDLFSVVGNQMSGNDTITYTNNSGTGMSFYGSPGNDTLNGGIGNDTFLFSLGDGQDLVQDNSGSADKMLFEGGINPLDLVISRQANDLRLAIHGSADQITVQNWYTSSVNQTETIQAGNGQTLLSTQVDQLIQAMASFTQQTGLSWDQAIDQQPKNVQAVMAASWQQLTVKRKASLWLSPCLSCLSGDQADQKDGINQRDQEDERCISYDPGRGR
jgi:Haemolysin-type calcium binding protein related domain